MWFSQEQNLRLHITGRMPKPLDHSTTEPATLETPPITNLNVVRSDRLWGSEVILIPEERDKSHLEPHHNKVNHQLRHKRGWFRLDSQKHCHRI